MKSIKLSVKNGDPLKILFSELRGEILKSYPGVLTDDEIVKKVNELLSFYEIHLTPFAVKTFDLLGIDYTAEYNFCSYLVSSIHSDFIDYQRSGNCPCAIILIF